MHEISRHSTQATAHDVEMTEESEQLRQLRVTFRSDSVRIHSSWKVGRVVYRAGLEHQLGSNVLRGSNPLPSAKKARNYLQAFL